MNPDAKEHGRGMIQELRARQKWHGFKEMDLAREIQWHIRQQSELEDQIMAWEIHLSLIAEDEKAPMTAFEKIMKRIDL